MKPLTDICPDPKTLLELEPEKLGHHVLGCLSDINDRNIERAIIAKTLSSNYHQSFCGQVAQAVNGAVDGLIAQCLLGVPPYDQNLIFLTRRGKKEADAYAANHDVDIAR